MSRAERWLLDVANLLVAGTGIVYAVMRYLMTPADEWMVVNHPWQPHVQHLHVLAAPLLVFAGGLIWRHHVLAKLRADGPGGRRSGLVLTALLAPMVLSGALIQVSVSEGWRTVWIAVHLITSGLWIVAMIAHRIEAVRSRRGRPDGKP